MKSLRSIKLLHLNVWINHGEIQDIFFVGEEAEEKEKEVILKEPKQDWLQDTYHDF